MSSTELADLRWYLEEYLRTPFGVYEDRGERVAGRLGEWGGRMFDAVFGAGRPAADEPIAEIMFRSAAPEWLALPWELLRDPGSSRPLALSGTTISRGLPGPMAPPLRVDAQRLRVLMVISRPRGTGDVGYRMVARPLVEQLAEADDQVRLVVLRPPTLTALTETLLAAKARGEPFHVVHFDGHGARSGDTGVLVFEKPGGGADPVPAADVADALAEAAVPVVVLNACQSGAIGKGLEATVATRLLAGGTASVVAMAYSVYALAAAKFMTAFYRRLVAGGRVADAVTEGRDQLAGQRERPSPKGPLPLQDWMVPVHYAGRDVVFRRRKSPHPDIAPAPETPRTEPFVGRDGLFYELESALRAHSIVTLHGPGGTGKTELAKAFGRWWRDTGAVVEADLVIWHAFEPGSASYDLRALLSTIGSRLVGTGFALLGPDERRARVVRALADRRALVVLDNFEAAYSMPDPTTATPALGRPERDELRGFLAEVAEGGRSAVLITSRCVESWLGDVRRIPVGGLSREEANEYADQLLAGLPGAQRSREDRAFGELLAWLNGHPLSMRLILPRLADTEPATLLDELRGIRPLAGDDDTADTDDDRTSSLSASIAYSFAHLRAESRTLLVLASLFYGAIDAGVLGIFSRQPAAPSRFTDADLDHWTAVLREAAQIGLLTRVRAATYAIHPALPAYLVRLWRAEGGNTYATQRAAAHLVLLDAFAALAGWASREIDSGNDAAALALIGLHRRNLGDQLGYSLQRQRWSAAARIFRALDRYWDTHGEQQEASEWADRALRLLDSADDKPRVLDDPAGSLWCYLVTMRAHRHLTRGALDDAERGFRTVYDALIAQHRSVGVRSNLAAICQSLEVLARRRNRDDDADRWHREYQAFSDRSTARTPTNMDTYRSGILARDRNDFDEAETCFRTSLRLSRAERDWYGVAANCRELGALAHRRGQLDEAEEHYLASRDAGRELTNPAHEAMTCQYLGALALQRRRWKDAEHWFRQSLVINEKQGRSAEVANCYYALGVIARCQGNSDDADALFRGSARIRERLGE